MSKTIQLCKRTNYPKLGYIIHRLKEKGIHCEFERDKNGETISSSHADYILLVDEKKSEEAENILLERWNKNKGELCPKGRTILDHMPDDSPCFQKYTNVIC